MILKWGILGLGNIAHGFCDDLLNMDNHKIYAVASRSQEKADAFLSKYSANHAYGKYQQLFEDPQVDIVYIATPHDSHLEYSIKAMKAGKHVLCEKPVAVNQSQFQKMADVAKEQKLFLMEAFWSKFNPSIKAVLQLIENNTIGDVNYVNVDFSYYRNDPPESRMINMDLAGGSLLDMGVYPVFLCYSVFGVPNRIQASATKHESGADLQTMAIFEYENGLAHMMSGFKSQSDMVAKIYGEKGQILIDAPWFKTQGFNVIMIGGESTRYDFPTRGSGFTYEIEECYRCISSGKTESEHWSYEDSMNMLNITDTIRDKIGLRYPFE